MATCQDVIRRALRNMGVLQAGDQPSGSDAADGLERLNDLIQSLPGFVLNGRFCDVATSAAYTAREGDRITVTGAVAITLPLTVSVWGRTRPPKDLAKVQIIGADVTNAGLWLYSATNGAWGQADDLAISADLPFGKEDIQGLAAQLAVDWADEFGPTAAIQPRTLALAQQSARSLKARFKLAEPVDWRRPSLPEDCATGTPSPTDYL